VSFPYHSFSHGYNLLALIESKNTFFDMTYDREEVERKDNLEESTLHYARAPVKPG